MKNNKKKIAVSVVAAILLVLLYLLIFAFSGQDGEKSGSLSSMISEKCAELLNAISGKHWTQNVIDSMAAYFEHPIRKLAHFSEYACMGVLLYGVETLEGEDPEAVSADRTLGVCLRRSGRVPSVICPRTLWVFCGCGAGYLWRCVWTARMCLCGENSAAKETEAER